MIIHIVGARPQFIKLFPIYFELNNRNIEQKIIHTGQHFDDNMSSNFFEEFNLPNPDYNLAIHSLSHGEMTGKMMVALDEILKDKSPKCVILYGDTNSTLAGALVSRKLNLNIAHIESGVRNNDLSMPEEINRIIVDRISDLLFCSTQNNLKNLKKESTLKDSEIIFSGDIMFDCVKLINNKKSLKDSSQKPTIMVTVHRADNTDNIQRLKCIIDQLNYLSSSHTILFPCHPRTLNIISKNNISCKFKLLDPMGYKEFISKLSKCEIFISDSGGAIKEAFYLNVPSIQLLSNPVWPELIELGISVQSEPQNIDDLIKEMKFNSFKCDNPFGDGFSRKIIADKIIEKFYA